ncbi:MAG: AgmX/PglI C-terminal domain-containing protein [Candidatus Binatia bacterium]|nr:AgmX/PglI C-terminal domain-containing protein [Candidatus Binatia bacterium]
MVITGVETGGPTRSLEVLEEQILAFLPQLQEVYEQERLQDAGLMGSIDVSMTITPEGRVSDLRFPRTRVSSDKLVAAVFDRMRTWTFPPAEGRVQLRYTLLFVPPGVDRASIFMWEKHLGSRLVVDRGGEGAVPVTVASLPEPGQPPAAKKEAATPGKPAKRPPPPVPSRSRVESAQRWESPTVLGWYRVIRPSALYAAPRDAADIITQLRPGTRVQVVKVVNGEWLEVRSVSNRPPGFLRRSNARPVAEVGRPGEGSQF